MAASRLSDCPAGGAPRPQLYGIPDRRAIPTLADNTCSRAHFATTTPPIINRTHWRFVGFQLGGYRDMIKAVRKPTNAWLPFCLVGALVATGCGASNLHTASNASASIASTRPPGGASVHAYRVLSESMEPTLPIRATVTVRVGTPAVGAIVVAHQPEGPAGQECGPKPHMVKAGGAPCDASVRHESKLKVVTRIVAGPGDEIYVRGGHVYRKSSGSREFVRERDSYIRACGSRPECDFPDPITIPSGKWFLMGDNRGESNDSRYWGPVPTAWIVGTVTQVHKPAF
jgi:signal peptidase I